MANSIVRERNAPGEDASKPERQKGEIYLLDDKMKDDKWISKFIDQAVSFPSKYVHDDLVDALAYIDQMDPESMGNFDIAQIEKDTRYQASDDISGY